MLFKLLICLNFPQEATTIPSVIIDTLELECIVKLIDAL